MWLGNFLEAWCPFFGSFERGKKGVFDCEGNLEGQPIFWGRGVFGSRVRFGPSCWLASVLVFISLRS